MDADGANPVPILTDIKDRLLQVRSRLAKENEAPGNDSKDSGSCPAKPAGSDRREATPEQSRAVAPATSSRPREDAGKTPRREKQRKQVGALVQSPDQQSPGSTQSTVTPDEKLVDLSATASTDSSVLEDSEDKSVAVVTAGIRERLLVMQQALRAPGRMQRLPLQHADRTGATPLTSSRSVRCSGTPLVAGAPRVVVAAPATPTRAGPVLLRSPSGEYRASSPQANGTKASTSVGRSVYLGTSSAGGAPVPRIPYTVSAARSDCQPPTAAKDDKMECQIVYDDGVPVSRDFSRNSSQVALLPRGSTVEVLEIAEHMEEGRVRGRIKSPAGWISLSHTDGTQFATPLQEPVRLASAAALPCSASGLRRSPSPVAAIRSLQDPAASARTLFGVKLRSTVKPETIEAI